MQQVKQHGPRLAGQAVRSARAAVEAYKKK
jgi:hypothetical protein